MAFQCTKSTKLINFSFKFLHRRISTNNFLKKIGLVDSEKCTFCEKETEKLAHLFWTCPKTQVFWTDFKVWLHSCQVITKESPLVRWPTRDTLQTKKKCCKQKRNAANKKETLQTKKERCK